MRRSDCFLLSKYTTVLSGKYTTFGDEGGMAATFGCLEPFDAMSEDWSGLWLYGTHGGVFRGQ